MSWGSMDPWVTIGLLWWSVVDGVRKTKNHLTKGFLLSQIMRFSRLFGQFLLDAFPLRDTERLYYTLRFASRAGRVRSRLLSPVTFDASNRGVLEFTTCAKSHQRSHSWRRQRKEKRRALWKSWNKVSEEVRFAFHSFYSIQGLDSSHTRTVWILRKQCHLSSEALIHSTRCGRRMFCMIRNNGPNGPNWPMQPVLPIIQFPRQHSASPPVTELP